jgi:hypothetical protein
MKTLVPAQAGPGVKIVPNTESTASGAVLSVGLGKIKIRPNYFLPSPKTSPRLTP